MDSEDLLFNAMHSGAPGSVSKGEGAATGTPMLGPASPDPFSTSTSLPVTFGVQGHVKMVVYDLDGRRVRTLLDGEERPGQRLVTWDGRDDQGAPVAHGTYEIRIDAAGRQESRPVQRRAEQVG